MHPRISGLVVALVVAALTILASPAAHAEHAKHGTASRAVTACRTAEAETQGGVRIELGTFDATGVRAPMLAKTLRREKRAVAAYNSGDDTRMMTSWLSVTHQWGILVRLCHAQGVEINTSGSRLW
jgi:hypothetical protein